MAHQIIAQVLLLDKPTDTGNIYPRAIIENALVRCFKTVLEGRMFVFPLEVTLWTADSQVANIGDALGAVERLYIETVGTEEHLMAQLQLYTPPKSGVKYRPTAWGSIGYDRVVRDDYEIQHINVQDDPEARLMELAMRKRKRSRA